MRTLFRRKPKIRRKIHWPSPEKESGLFKRGATRVHASYSFKVVAVEPKSPADECGIPTHLPPYAYGGEEESAAVITEVNSLPLNPFTKSEQFFQRIRPPHPLPCASSLAPISLILHPSDFVSLLKADMKMNRSYKSFLHEINADGE